MAYSDFKLADVIQRFGLTVDTSRDLFAHIPPVPLGEATRRSVEQNTQLALLIGNEKARSELIVAPILADLWRQTGHVISLYSGVELDVDPNDGLTGACDFLIGRGPQLPIVSPPVLVIVEAKKDDIQGGFGQCIAAMIAALRMNSAAKTGVTTVYGCITNGVSWKFLRLSGKDLAIDQREYLLSEVDRVFGILMSIVTPPPAVSGAA
jgi:hypothetical protein